MRVLSPAQTAFIQTNGMLAFKWVCRRGAQAQQHRMAWVIVLKRRIVLKFGVLMLLPLLVGSHMHCVRWATYVACLVDGYSAGRPKSAKDCDKNSKLTFQLRLQHHSP